MKNAGVSRLHAFLIFNFLICVDNDTPAFRSLWGKQKSYKCLIKTKDTAVFHPDPFAGRLYLCKYVFFFCFSFGMATLIFKGEMMD